MTLRDLDTLIALDWINYQCQCPHHGDTGCHQPARYTLAIHAINTCNQPDLDHFGNRIEIRCAECTTRLWANIRATLGMFTGRWECGSCGAPLVDVFDVLRSIEALR